MAKHFDIRNCCVISDCSCYDFSSVPDKWHNCKFLSLLGNERNPDMDHGVPGELPNCHEFPDADVLFLDTPFLT